MLNDNHLANAIRALSIDAVQQANSGHPGMPMGMADIATVLWRHLLKHNPANPDWLNRDRFVLSNGHGSMLLYSLLYLTGYDLTLEDLKQFRQLHSKTPGHPEFGYAPGVETTTGPLGQGLANAVGMAIAEKMMAAHFNRPTFDIIDHYTYCFVGDGCLMEGISHEACSLAGTLALSKLIVIYDDNNISIDGEVAQWYSENTPQRFRAYGWHVIEQVDGHDTTAIKKAIERAKTTNQPSIICCQTTIGFGSPKHQGKASSHGAPLGDEEIIATKTALNLPLAPFTVAPDILQQWDCRNQGYAMEADWQQCYEHYQQQFPELAQELQRRNKRDLPKKFDALFEQFIQSTQQDQQAMATRKVSQMVLEKLGSDLPELVGGSADLSGPNHTMWSGSKAIDKNEADGNYIYYGVREFAMAAIASGISLHRGLRPYVGTFLIFSDYARNAIRMSALMKQPVIYVLTHDSIGLGEDGPTHQPISQLAGLRMIPNLSVWRPADATEAIVAWQQAIKNTAKPTAICLSRQTCQPQARDATQLASIERGGYVLYETQPNQCELILIATGSEVQIVVAAAKELAPNLAVRVVSMPSVDQFEQQSKEYRQQVLPANVTRRIAVEAAHRDYWYKYVGLEGKVIGMDSFGESGKADDVFLHFGFTVKRVVKQAHQLCE